MQSSNIKTFKAKAYKNTPQGEVYLGNVLMTIDFCSVDFGSVKETILSSGFILKPFEEMDDLPTFNILDFPDNADQPDIDIQDCISTPQPSTVPANGHVDLINSLDDDLIDLPDFQNVDQVIDDFGLTVEQEEALINDENVQWIPMNSPAGKLGIEVNELGEVRSINPDIHLMEGEDKRMKISKYNKSLG